MNYIPYENRPKNLFHGKSSTELKYSTKTRRNKQFQANLTVDDKKHSERTKSRISRLNKKLKRLGDLGIDVSSDARLITKQTSKSEDCSDPEIELKVKHKKRSLVSLSKRTKQECPPSASDLDKSTDTLLTSVNFVNSIRPSKPKEKLVRKRKKNISKHSFKESSKLGSLNSDTVKKIARELIRKKGTSLLSLPKPSRTTAKKK